MANPSEIPLPPGLVAELQRLAADARTIESTRNGLIGGFLYGSGLNDVHVRLSPDSTHLIVVEAAPTPTNPTKGD